VDAETNNITGRVERYDGFPMRTRWLGGKGLHSFTRSTTQIFLGVALGVASSLYAFRCRSGGFAGSGCDMQTYYSQAVQWDIV